MKATNWFFKILLFIVYLLYIYTGWMFGLFLCFALTVTITCISLPILYPAFFVFMFRRMCLKCKTKPEQLLPDQDELPNFQVSQF